MLNAKQPHGVARLFAVVVHIAEVQQTTQPIGVRLALAILIEGDTLGVVDNTHGLSPCAVPARRLVVAVADVIWPVALYPVHGDSDVITALWARCFVENTMWT